MSAAPRPEGIPGSSLTGPFPVGVYAARLRQRLRDFTRVQRASQPLDLGE